MFQQRLSGAFKDAWEFATRRFLSIKKPVTINIGLSQDPELDYDFILDPKNYMEIQENIKLRKGIGNIRRVVEINEQLKTEQSTSRREKLLSDLVYEGQRIPNTSHPALKSYKDHPKVVKSAQHLNHPFKAKEFSELAKELRLARTDNLSNLTGHRSYYFVGDLADLEHALIKYTLTKLISKKFKLVSVPDVIPADVIERCGMNTKGERSQVYFLDEAHGKDLCLSGTAEMALAGLLSNTVHETTQLPIKLAAVSRCYRSEASSIAEEKGIYRVHQFTKVEMFGISHPTESENLLNQFVEIQEENLKSLGIDYQLLDMPTNELGAPAHRKYDVEAWLPGRQMYGEVSSSSDCTTFQARRLNIKFRNKGRLEHVHTVNGTACAIPRMMIALLETHQLKNGNIQIPEPLRPFFNGKEEFQKQRIVPKLRPKAKDRSRNSY